ncbi:hypothetical protein [Achromobacter sp. NCFB-sbj8-Ac1-l]|uniref:hypothetical protein n=1 Tax=unclassified Achromobacter TaxID=2626865 RepID=UPI004046FE72
MSGLSSPKPSPVPDDGFKADQDILGSGYRRPLSKEGGWSLPRLVRTNIIPIAFRGHSLKRLWLTAIGAAGVIASLGEMSYRWGVWWFWLIIPFGAALMIGYRLLRKRFVSIAGWFNVESDKHGSVYITTLGGDCPVCNGEIGLKDVGAKREIKIVIQCKADPTHRWGFNSADLEELEPRAS